tara:strand:- start:1929 stop:2726 length:798 start_codon:yes stop_codon:yes gene_type:complete
MSQNLVIPGADNKVRFVFADVNLTASTDLKITFGAETYTKLLNPAVVFVESATTLALDLNATAEVGKIFATIKYFDGGTTLGEDITSRELGNSTQIIVSIGTQLIIEDGSIVTGANSLSTDAELLAWASIRGKPVPATEPERDALQILAMDHITSKENRLKGGRVSELQALPYPRVGLCVNGFNIDKATIPTNAKQAQLELAILAFTSGLFVDGQNQNVQREKLDTLEVEYFSGGSWAQIRTDSADTYLKPLMINNGSDNIMVRV